MPDRQNQHYEELYNRLLGRAEALHLNNKKRIRIGLILLGVLPVVLIIIRRLTDSDKVVFLLVWVFAMFAICIYLISIEYIDSQIARTIEEVTEREADFGELFPDSEAMRERIHSRIEGRIESRIESRAERRADAFKAELEEAERKKAARAEAEKAGRALRGAQEAAQAEKPAAKSEATAPDAAKSPKSARAGAAPDAAKSPKSARAGAAQTAAPSSAPVAAPATANEIAQAEKSAAPQKTDAAKRGGASK